MCKIIFLIMTFTLMSVFLASSGNALGVDYERCNTIQEIIELETKLILQCKLNDVNELANLYSSRGETYLLSGQFDDAVNDFSVAYTLLENTQTKNTTKFRLIFNEIIWHVLQGNKDEVEVLGQHLISVFDEICFHKALENKKISLFTNTIPIFFCKTKIVGPDQEPYPGWCKEVVLSTGVALAQLINVLPKNAAKIALGSIIAILEQKALDCCEAGGLWKACVGPLAEKFNNWNQKWKVLRVPPDPAFD